MKSYSRQRRHQLGLDLPEGRIYEHSLGFYPNQKDQGKKTRLLGSQVKSSTLWGKRRLLAQR